MGSDGAVNNMGAVGAPWGAKKLVGVAMAAPFALLIAVAVGVVTAVSTFVQVWREMTR